MLILYGRQIRERSPFMREARLSDEAEERAESEQGKNVSEV